MSPEPLEDAPSGVDRARAGVWSAPGRVNLMGEHTDYNDGLVLPVALPQRTSVTVAVRDDDLLVARSREEEGEVRCDVRTVAPGDVDGWGAYLAGVVWALREEGLALPGLDVQVDGDVPVGAGLSSSAALECALALACRDLLHAPLSRARLAAVCQRAENDFVGVPTGVLDQTASLLCRAGRALLLDVRSGRTEQVPLPLDEHGAELLVVDTRVQHALVDGGYAERRASCEEAARRLGVDALRDVAPDDLDAGLHVLGDAVLRRRVRHVVSEVQRVRDAVAALGHGDLTAVGALMDASHRSLRDDYEVSCAELDTAVSAAVAAGALGARMTGGGFGGSAVALVPAQRVAQVRDRVAAEARRRGHPEPRVLRVPPSEGAGRSA